MAARRVHTLLKRLHRRYAPIFRCNRTRAGRLAHKKRMEPFPRRGSKSNRVWRSLLD